MDEQQKIHILCNELIPLYNELELETQRLIIEHTKQCKECKEALLRVNVIFNNEEDSYEDSYKGNSKNIQVTPYRSLILFKKMIAVFFLLARAIVLGLLAFNWISNYSPEQTSLFTAQLILFYFPLVVIINTINFLYFRNKWFWVMLVTDIIILFFFENLFV
jgi:hypothetical protein